MGGADKRLALAGSHPRFHAAHLENDGQRTEVGEGSLKKIQSNESSEIEPILVVEHGQGNTGQNHGASKGHYKSFNSHVLSILNLFLYVE